MTSFELERQARRLAGRPPEDILEWVLSEYDNLAVSFSGASIGCEPCTRAVLPNQGEREGRWWREQGADKECGLHADNVRKAG